MRKRRSHHSVGTGMRKEDIAWINYEITMEDASASLQSYLGMFCHCDSHSLQEKILEEFVLTHGDRISPEEEIWIYYRRAI